MLRINLRIGNITLVTFKLVFTLCLILAYFGVSPLNPQFFIALSAHTENVAAEELDPGFPIWSVILTVAGIVLIVLLLLIFTFNKKK